MSVDCQCGGTIEKFMRIIETDETTAEWTKGAFTVAPVKLINYKCDGCGREGRIVENLQGEEIFRMGL